MKQTSKFAKTNIELSQLFVFYVYNASKTFNVYKIIVELALPHCSPIVFTKHCSNMQTKLVRRKSGISLVSTRPDWNVIFSNKSLRKKAKQIKTLLGMKKHPQKLTMFFKGFAKRKTKKGLTGV